MKKRNQAIEALPGMTKLLLDDFKAISLAFSIGFVEMMGRGSALAYEEGKEMPGEVRV